MRKKPIRPSPSPSRALRSLASFVVRPAALALFAFALLIGAPAPSAESATADVLVGDFWFCSAGFQSGVCLTTITVGDTVTWEFAGAFTHTTTDCAGDCGSLPFGTEWDSLNVTPNTPNPTFSHTFTSTGVFPYRCSLHPLLMRGQITVTGAVGGIAELPELNGNEVMQMEADAPDATFTIAWAVGIAAVGAAALAIAGLVRTPTLDALTLRCRPAADRPRRITGWTAANNPNLVFAVMIAAGLTGVKH